METVVQSHYREALKRAGHLAQAADHHGALAAYDEAIRLAPCRADAHYEMGLLHHKLGRVAEAIACFERAAELAPDDASVFNNLGVLYSSQGALAKAAESLETAIRIEPQYVEATFNQAKVYVALGMTEEAGNSLRRCLLIEPQFDAARKLLSELGFDVEGRRLCPSRRSPRTQKLVRLRANGKIRIKILSHAELERDLSKRKQWGDHWVKHELEKEFTNLGLAVVEDAPDVVLYLFGLPVRGLPKNTYNMVWVYSHPDMVTPQNLRAFDKIFSLSASYAEKLRAMGYDDVEVMIGATSKTPLVREKLHDIVFVGNTRGPHGRKIVSDVGNVPYDFKVWGRGWDSLLSPQFYGGSYYDYEKLGELYASSLVSLNDHHPDMAREGFVAVKIFDILASGGFAISDRNAGIEEIFGDTVPQYETAEHLRELLDRYITHPDERRELMDRGRRIALSHTWRKRAEQMVAAIASARGTVAASARRSAQAPRARTPAMVSEMRPKVFYVDTLSASHAACNVNGVMRAYRKVATLETFDYRGLAARYGPARMNQMLVETALRFRPDLIHLGKSESVAGAAIKAIKDQLDTYVIHFYGDFRWDPQPWVVDIGRCADCTLFSNTDDRILTKYKAAGVKHIGGWWDAGTDPDVFYPRPVEKAQDVVFMGNNVDIAHDGYVKRRELIEGAIERGLDVHVYGKGWEYLSNQGHSNLHLHAFVTENEFAEACSAAKITLGINGVNDVRMYASWRRAVNSMASGAFHLTHYVPDMETVFENRKHLVWFNSVPEAMELIEYYLSHEDERERIAASGRQRVLARHTWDARIAGMIDRWRKAGGRARSNLAQSLRPGELAYRQRVLSGDYRENVELEVDMVEAMFTRWRKGKYLFSHPQRQLYEAIATRVADKTLCDIGSGSGLGCLILAQGARSVVGLEKVSGSTEFSKKCFPLKNVRFVHEDVVKCTLPDASFDVVTAIEVIEHLVDYRGALTQMRRILKDHGTLYISSPNRNSDIVGKDRPRNKHHVREWTAGEFHDTLLSYFGSVQLYDFSLGYPQAIESSVTPLVAVCKDRRPTLPILSSSNKGVSRSVQHESSPDDVGGSARDMRAKARVAMEPRASTAARSPLRLHLGCGSTHLPGYVNIDKYNPGADRVLDARSLDYPDNSVDEIYTSHMIEHVVETGFVAMLLEWERVLKENGRLIIRCPNILTHIMLWLEGDDAYRWGAGLDSILGMQNRGPGYPNRNLFTVSRLGTLVEQAGFEVIRCVAFPSRSGHLADGDILCEAVKAQCRARD